MRLTGEDVAPRTKPEGTSQDASCIPRGVNLKGERSLQRTMTGGVLTRGDLYEGSNARGVNVRGVKARGVNVRGVNARVVNVWGVNATNARCVVM